MSKSATSTDKSIPAGALPALEFRDLPDPVPLRKMVGPGIMLAGMALGSGEFLLWPYITFKSQFIFFWACIVGVTMQYFINMEITRWTLATGETVVTGFCRMGKFWAFVFLVMNIVPWIVPAWTTSSAKIATWLLWPPDADVGNAVQWIAMGSLIGCGVILTAGPVVYETVERLQLVLVATVMVLVLLLAFWLVSDRPEVLVLQAKSVITLGAPDFVPSPDVVPTTMLLGALAFAGAGGTLNLAQSDYIKDKGYGMGAYIGRMTSVITGKAEPAEDIGFQFQQTEKNVSRWSVWWRNAATEHFFSFFATCLICLVLLTSIAYCLMYDRDGQLTEAAKNAGSGLGFVRVEADVLDQQIGRLGKTLFLLMGIAILLTTEIGILDATSRTSANIVRTIFWGRQPKTPASRVYFFFLWLTILVGCGLLVILGGGLEQLRIASAMNGFVMFIYSITLIWLNRRYLHGITRMPIWRMTIMWAVVAFFGAFSAWAAWGLIM
ncbi:MAG: Nramp family divalent metal transporter [Planctomycetales bacterium]|nr:Nramp family divalent metal transporter [Planctomycetales bacterium]